MKTNDRLGKRITALRNQKGLSQAELAKTLNISASTLGMYEQGRRDPGLDTLVSLAQMLEVSTDFLLTGKDSKYAGSKREIRLRVAKQAGDSDPETDLASFVCDGTGGFVIYLT